VPLSPQDIVRKEFREAFRGYNQADVDLFLDNVTEELSRLQEENQRLKARVDALERSTDRAHEGGPDSGSTAALDELRRTESEIRTRLRRFLEEQLALLEATEAKPAAPRAGRAQSGVSTRETEAAQEFWERE
jgi:DivIVA domain-containing protein